MKSTILEALNQSTSYLKEHGIRNPRLDAELLLAHTLRFDRIDLYIHSDRILDEVEDRRFKELINRRADHEPIAYILGKKEFMSLEFRVTPQVLIPRPETELLVEEVLKIAKEMQDKMVIVDLGTGCGNIAISISRLLGCSATIYATDISRDALLVAKENIEAFGLEGEIILLEGDLFCALEGLSLNGRVDIVISNPPYIVKEEWEDLPIEVRGYEPRIALDGGKDGMEFYSRIIKEALSYLREGGVIALEMGIGQSKRIVDLFDSCKLFPKIIKDYKGIDRVIVAKKEFRIL